MNEIKEHKQKRDRLLATLSKDQKFRFVFVKNTRIAQEARQKHNLCPRSAFFLSKAMAGACLLASLLKGEERIIVSIYPEKDINLLYAEALQVGEVRGFIKFAEGISSLEKETTSLGKGIFRVEKILYENFKPVFGSVEQVKGDITTEFNQYLAYSEQIPSIVTLETELDKEGNIKTSWGTMLQALPGTSRDEIRSLHEKINPQENIPNLIQEEHGEELLKKILPYDFSITNNTPTDFYCRCSLEKFKEKLLTLTLEDLVEMKQDNQNELICQYCNQHYFLAEQDFDSLIEKLKNRKPSHN